MDELAATRRRRAPAAPIRFLDVDGVLNRAGLSPARRAGLVSWIEPELAARLDAVVRATGAEVVMSSSWREDRPIDDLRDHLARAGVDVPPST